MWLGSCFRFASVSGQFEIEPDRLARKQNATGCLWISPRSSYHALNASKGM